MKSLVLSAVIATAMLPAAAHAEDFLGGRIGLVGGWDHVVFEVENIGGTGTDIDRNWDGATFGIVTGYHFPLGEGAIIGIGTSTMFSNNSKKFTDGANTFKVEAGRDLEIHAKAGVIVGETALLYAKVGYANAKVKAKAVINNVTYKDSETGSGLRLGVGTEVSLNDSFSFLGEYRYTDYEKNFSRHQVVAGFAYKF